MEWSYKKISEMENPVAVLDRDSLLDRKPTRAKIRGTDLVVTKVGEDFSVLYGRCLHRGALMGDGFLEGENLICGLHNWDYRVDTGVSEYNPVEKLYKFGAAKSEGKIRVDEAEVVEFEKKFPPKFDANQYLGEFQDTNPEGTEVHTSFIQELARNGLKNVGRHGPVASMGVDRRTLPSWDSIQILPGQLAVRPLLDEDAVSTEVVIGPAAKKPVKLKIPLMISDMSFGALSPEAKTALAKGAAVAGTAICSGEGGMLPAEQENSEIYFLEMGSGEFGFSEENLKKVQAFHFKGGQGAKVGTGGHLPGEKVTEEIAKIRGIEPGQDSVSPATFKNLKTVEDFKKIAEKVRKISGGIPVGFKLAASRIEQDLEFALAVGVDYVILDGRGGATGAAPLLFRDHICVPTIPALARARKFLDEKNAKNISLIVTGGLRVSADFVKALALGADAIALANSAIQAAGCVAMRACHTGNCPVGVATQKEELRKRLEIAQSAKQVKNFLEASTELIAVMARACGHDSVEKFSMDDLTTFDPEMARLSGISYAGVGGI